MCMVSMVIDNFKQRLPVEYWPNFTPSEAEEVYKDLKKIISLLERIDKKLNQPDCIDPEKAKYLKDIEDAIKKIRS